MSVRNGEKFVGRAIRSILEQSMPDFEFLIADDMSTDGTAASLCKAASADKRIKIVVNYKNLGLTKSLNKLIDMASGDYLARIDADDASRSDRLEKQCSMLGEGFVMSASCYRAVDTEGKMIYSHCPHHNPDALQWSLIFRNNIRHSTVMWRSDLGLSYDERYKYAQDYDMWCRISRKGRIGVVTEPLSDITVHESAITSSMREEQDEAAEMISAEQFRHHTGKELTRMQSRNLRLIHYLKDGIQFGQFSSLSGEEVEEALSSYSMVLEKFSFSEEVIKEMEKDMMSVLEARKGSRTEQMALEIMREFGKK